MNKKEIDILNSNNWGNAIGVIEEHWNDDYGNFYIEGKKGKQILELTTGGWSDNEEFISELQNTLFWFLWWQESRRGRIL